MNNTSKEKAENMTALEPKALEQALGSQFALQVALQTMKERCHNLQLRLANVEEENIYLRSKKNSPVLNRDISLDVKGDLEQLQEQVSQLTRQKSQLTHHIYMVATENQQLWNRLSRVTQANQSLGSHLSKISDTLSKHDSTGTSKAEFLKLPVISNSVAKQLELKGFNNPSINPDANDQQSLDEISLKLINSLIQEKAELEDQYSQMVDIQSGHAFPIHNLGFAYMDQEDDSTLKDVNEHCGKLQEMKKILAEQHKVLKSTIEKFEKANNDKHILCHKCKDKAKRQSVVDSQAEDKAYMDTLRQWGAAMQSDIRRTPDPAATPDKTNILMDTNTRSENKSPSKNPEDVKNEDRLCPMCGQFYPRQLPYEEFQAHVMTHFNDEFDPTLENFEVVM